MIFKATALTLALLGVAGVAAAQSLPRNGSLPSVSPDGRWIAFGSDRRDSTWQIYVIRPTGRGERRLTNTREPKHTPAWDPDGDVLYQSDHGDTTVLCRVPFSGGRRHPLVALEAKTIVPSPDGRRIAYTVGDWSRNRIYVSDADGGHAVAITDSSAAYYNLAWAPDGHRLAVTRADGLHNLQIWLMNEDGDRAYALTNFGTEDGRPQCPAWSPDGRRIAIQSGIYNRDRPELSDAYIWVLEVATARAIRLTTHTRPRLDETPAWFPDGERIAFQSDRTGCMEIWMMDADGRNERQVTHTQEPVPAPAAAATPATVESARLK